MRNNCKTQKKWMYDLFSAAGAALAATIAAGLFLWWWLNRRSDQEDSRPSDRHPQDTGPKTRAEFRLLPQADTAEPIPDPIPGPSSENAPAPVSETLALSSFAVDPVHTNAAETPTTEPETAVPPLDELQRIRGIGPKTAGLLRSAGILTYAQLARASVVELHDVLSQAGIHAIVDPATWPEQARLAAQGDWDTLETLQEELRTRR